jgi:quercetin dioxygenase-like cupin family protein
MLACLGGAVLLGQDVLKVAPAGVVKVEYEDAQVRVLRFKEPAGSKLAMHSHPAYVSVGLTDDVFHYSFPDGKSADDKSKAGAVQFSKAVTHAGQNTGKTASESIMVELKTKPAAVAAGDMAQVNPTMCKVPPHGMLKMHSHPGGNVVVYLSGGQLKSTSADGKVEQATIAPGTVRANHAGKHSNENLGDKPTEAVLIELKTASK